MSRHLRRQRGEKPASVAFTTASQYAAQILTSAIGIVLLKMLTVTMGSHEYGQYATALTFITILSILTDLGVGAVTPRDIVKNPTRESEILSYGLGLRLLLSVGVIPFAGLAGALIYAGHGQGVVRTGILLLSPYIVGDAIRQISCAHYTAMGENHRASIVTVLQQVLLLGATAVVVSRGMGPIAIMSAYSAVSLLTGLVSYLAVRRVVRFRPRADRGEWSYVFKSSISVGLIQVVNLVYLRVDSVLLSVIDGTTSAGIYSVAYTAISPFLTLPGYLMSSLIPHMARGDAAAVERVMTRAAEILIVIAGVFAASVFVARHEFVRLISSAQFDQSVRPMSILMIGMVFGYVTTVVVYGAVSMGVQNKLPLISLIVLIVNVSLNLLLIPLFSTTGAAAATAGCDFLMMLLVSRFIFIRLGIVLRILRFGLRVAVCTATAILAGTLTLQVYRPPGLILRGADAALAAVIAFAGCAAVVGVFRSLRRYSHGSAETPSVRHPTA